MVTPQDIQVLAALALVSVGLVIGYVCGLSDGKNSERSMLAVKAEYNRWLDRIIHTCWNNQWPKPAMILESTRGHIVAGLLCEDYARKFNAREKK